MELNNEDVVSTGIEDSCFAFGLGSTFQTVELIIAARKKVSYNNPPLAVDAWFTDMGVRCKVLRTDGGGWKTGKIRFRVDFIPDEPKVPATPPEPQSPLSDLRSNLDI